MQSDSPIIARRVQVNPVFDERIQGAQVIGLRRLVECAEVIAVAKSGIRASIQQGSHHPAVDRLTPRGAGFAQD